MRSFIRSMVILSSLCAVSLRAAEIGYIEDFALATDRALCRSNAASESRSNHGESAGTLSSSGYLTIN